MVIPYMPMLVPPVNWTGYGDLTLYCCLSVLQFILMVGFF